MSHSGKTGGEVAVNVLTAVMGTVISLFFGVILTVTFNAAQNAKAEAADATKMNMKQEAQIAALSESMQRVESTVVRMDEKVSDLYVYLRGVKAGS